MAQQNMSAHRVRPEHDTLITLRVLRAERPSPSFARVVVGGDELAHFRHMGFDQWFRLFLPVAAEGMTRLPRKLTMLAYARFLTTSKTTRPVLRNYSVAGYRADGAEGPELDIDFVLHRDPATGTAGPAAEWATSCAPGDPVALIDEGISFTPDPAISEFRIVADESALPAALGILAGLPADATGHAILEVPDPGDVREHAPAPAGLRVSWLVRTGHSQPPGQLALAHAAALPAPIGRVYGWVAGETALPVGLRRHWVGQGIAKGDILFCGYWRAGRSQG